jgi:flagellar hook assembly protein FlgD
MAGTSGISSSLPINKLISNTTTPTSSTSSNSASITSQLGPTAFLQLLTTQMSNQDPLNPMDDTQSVSQLAQFSALQASQNLETSFSNFQSNFAVLQSAQLVGATVTVQSTDAAGNAKPQLTVVDANGNVLTDANGNPETFTTSQILGIK